MAQPIEGSITRNDVKFSSEGAQRPVMLRALTEAEGIRLHKAQVALADCAAAAEKCRVMLEGLPVECGVVMFIQRSVMCVESAVLKLKKASHLRRSLDTYDASVPVAEYLNVQKPAA